MVRSKTRRCCPWVLARQTACPGSPSYNRPVISVVLATRNRANILDVTLGHISRQRVDDNWEIVIADNGSSDHTPDILDRWRGDLPLRGVCVEEPGKSRALNAALQLATGDLLVFTDDDIIPRADWLQRMAAAARAWPDHSVFGGRIVLAPPPGAPDWLFDLEERAVNFARYGPADESGPTTATPFGPSFAVRAEVMRGLRFEESVGPDGSDGYAMGTETMLLVGLVDPERPAVYVADSVVHHIVRPEQLDRRALCLRSFRMGRGLVVLCSRHNPPSLRYVFGAPRYLWRAAAGALWRTLPLPDRQRSAHFEAELRFHRLRGEIMEHRRMSSPREQTGPHRPAPGKGPNA